MNNEKINAHKVSSMPQLEHIEAIEKRLWSAARGKLRPTNGEGAA